MRVKKIHFLCCLYWTLLPICHALAYSSTKAAIPFLRKEDLVGLWKIARRCHFPYPNPSERYKDSLGNSHEKHGMLLCLNPDGTFAPFLEEDDMDYYNTDSERDLDLLLGRGGCWTYQDQHLLLASRQQEPQAGEDDRMQGFLFRGPIIAGMAHSDISSDQLNPANPFVNHDEHETAEPLHPSQGNNKLPITIPHGILSTGQFANDYDTTFEEPIFLGSSRNTRGSFVMHQIEANKGVLESRDSNNHVTVTLDEFLNRTFYLATAPHRTDPENSVMMDVRVLEMTFYSNHTFVARGTEKILRGTYGLLQDEHTLEQLLWFQVSLYGTGRNVPGSVFSEGRLLSQEDRRGYVGTLSQPSPLNNNANGEIRRSVYGTYYAGFDVLQAHRSDAESLGTFLLQEIEQHKVEEEDDLTGTTKETEDPKAVGDPAFGAEDGLADLYDMGFDFLGDSMNILGSIENDKGDYDNDAIDEYDGHGDYGFKVDDYDYYADHLEAIEDYYDDADYFDEMEAYDVLDVDMDGSYRDVRYKIDMDDLPFQ